MSLSLLELFCDVDDFCQEFESKLAQRLLESEVELEAKAKPGPKSGLSRSELMTLLIHFHQASYRDLKAYYQKYVLVYLRAEFPGLVSYQRFVELIPQALLALCAYLKRCFGRCTGLSFVDSTSIKVCHSLRIHSHKVFAGVAKRGKNSMGWFFGFKLHLICNDRGELLNVFFTPANVDERKGLRHMLQHMSRAIFGKLFADRGYISKSLMLQLLSDFGIQLFTGLKKNMHTTLPVLYEDAVLLRKRTIIETITDQLKNISQLEHSRHRSISNFMANALGALIAYCHQPKKPALRFDGFIPSQQPFQLVA